MDNRNDIDRSALRLGDIIPSYGTKKEQNPYGGALEEYVASYIRGRTYAEFRRFLDDAKAYKRIGNMVVDDDQIDMLDIPEDKFMIAKEHMNESESFYQEANMRLDQKIQEDLENHIYRPDYKKILNGNFPKRKKEVLTDAEKVLHNVHGLHMEQYDIYYDEEADRFTTVYYDITTPNEYFFTFTKYLELMGKRKNIPLNPKIPLILFDRTLMGINTDFDISLDLKRLCFQEARINPWFYFRELARVPPKGGGDLKRYELTIASYTFIWLYCQCINTFREQMRQSGKTYDMQHIGGYEFAIGSKNIKALVVHFKLEEAGKNRGAMIDAVNNMPKWAQLHNIRRTIKGGQEVWKDGSDMKVGQKTKEAVNEWCSNILKIVAVGATETSASQAGRGDTLPIVFIDEMNYISQTISLLTAITFANSMASKLAEKAGERYGMHFASTAGELDKKSGQIMYRMTHDEMCQWTPELFGYSYADLKNYVGMSRRSTIFFSYQYNELGFGEKDFDFAFRSAPTTSEFLKDFMNVWNASSGKSIYDPELMNRIRKVSERSIHASYIYGKLHRFIYFPKAEGITFEDHIGRVKNLHVGIDIATGGGGDYSVIYAINMENAETVFVFRHNNLTIDDFASLIIHFFRWMRDSYPTMKIILSPELDGIGSGMLPMLLKDPVIESMIFRCLYYFNDKVRQSDLVFYDKAIDTRTYAKYGTRMKRSFDGQSHSGDEKLSQRQWLTTTLLTTLVEKHPFVFVWKELVMEMSTLVIVGGAGKPRIQAASGQHDDCVVAMLHAYAPLWNPWYQENMIRFFNFYVDFMKIPHDPFNSHVIDDSVPIYAEQYDVEGQLSYTIRQRRTEYGEYWDELHVFKIVNGEKIELPEGEGVKELYSDPELSRRDELIHLRPRPFPKSLLFSEEKNNLLTSTSRKVAISAKLKDGGLSITSMITPSGKKSLI